jgi:hypothetical protein
VVVLCTAAACFPTFQSARVEPGFRLDAGFTALADQRRNNVEQGHDYIPYLNPAYGFGRRVEVGVPFGFYFEEGFKSNIFEGERTARMVWPYVKIALNEATSREHVAIIGQAAFTLPANLGIRYGRDFGSWEPHVGLNYIWSGGTAGDDPTVTRYQEAHQTLVSATLGATLHTRGRPAFEVGVLRNEYDEVTGFGPQGSITARRTYVDLFVGFRLGCAAIRALTRAGARASPRRQPAGCSTGSTPRGDARHGNSCASAQRTSARMVS